MKIKRLGHEELKLFACITMLIDHIGVALIPSVGLRIIGRLAFPIFCFQLVEGVYHTHKPLRFGLRLAAGALLAELPYDLMSHGSFTWHDQSVMVTLLLGFLMAMIIRHLDNPVYKVLAVFPFAVAAELLQADYAGHGILIVAIFALTRGMRNSLLIQSLLLSVVFAGMSSMRANVFGVQIPIQLLGVCAMMPIGLYSGKKHSQSKIAQWGFYLFYPIHMAVIYVIKLLTA